MAGPLNNSPAEIIQYLLAALGLAMLPVGTATLVWPVYESTEPDQPDNCVTIYDTDSIMEGKTHVNGQIQSHYGFQVRVRGVDKPTAFAKANAIAIGMDPLANVTVALGTSTYSVASITRKGDPLYIGTEKPQSLRSIYTINSIVALRQAS